MVGGHTLVEKVVRSLPEGVLHALLAEVVLHTPVEGAVVGAVHQSAVVAPEPLLVAVHSAAWQVSFDTQICRKYSQQKLSEPRFQPRSQPLHYQSCLQMIHSLLR